MSNPFEEEAAAEEAAQRETEAAEEKGSETSDKKTTETTETRTAVVAEEKAERVELKNPFGEEDSEYDEIAPRKTDPLPKRPTENAYKSSYNGNLDKDQHDDDHHEVTSKLVPSPVPYVVPEHSAEVAINGAGMKLKFCRKRVEKSDWKRYLRSIYSILKIVELLCCIGVLICALIAEVKSAWWSADISKFVEVVFGVGIACSVFQFILTFLSTLSPGEAEKRKCCMKLSWLHDRVWAFLDAGLSVTWSFVTLAGCLICAFAAFTSKEIACEAASSSTTTCLLPTTVSSYHNALLPGAVFAALAFAAYLIDATLALIRCCALVKRSAFQEILGLSVFTTADHSQDCSYPKSADC